VYFVEAPFFSLIEYSWRWLDLKRSSWRWVVNFKHAGNIYKNFYSQFDVMKGVSTLWRVSVIVLMSDPNDISAFVLAAWIRRVHLTCRCNCYVSNRGLSSGQPKMSWYLLLTVASTYGSLAC
jgi:hypothetical protein